MDDECQRRFDLLRWDLQDIHRDLERLGDLVKETHTLAREIQLEMDDMVREGVIK
jgi:hypothetical protein